MSEDNVYVHDNNTHKKPKSVYQQLSGILNALKTEEITVNEAMAKIQLKDSNKQSIPRPYCKVNNGLMELYGITPKPIVMTTNEWKNFLKLAKSNYIDNYMKYNEERLNGVKNISKPPIKKQFNKKNSNNVNSNNVNSNNVNNNNVNNNKQNIVNNDEFEEIEADKN
jgi:hypothetical protein